MLDLNFIRENPKAVESNLKDRGMADKSSLVKEFVNSDKVYNEIKKNVDELRHKRNKLSLEISELKKSKKDASNLMKEASLANEQISKEENMLNNIKNKIDDILKSVPNILHESVPRGKDASENKEVRKSGRKPKFDFEVKNHIEIAEALGIADFDKSANVAGHGFYYLKGDLALLNQALVRFAIDHLTSKGYLYVEPPLMLRKKPYEGVTDISAFENVMYKVENEDLYLVATSEHPIVAMHMDEVVKEEDLPLKFVGYSMCFRKEVGGHGVDTKGLFRTHQFNKVEQVIICKPEDSWKLHEELLKNTEELFQALELPYRIMLLCSGDTGFVSAKTYDLEVWTPKQDGYREAASCSNCTDFQARRLNIKYGKHGGQKSLVHTLNNTAIATSRALVAILENYQQKDGTVKIPKALQKYMGGKSVIGAVKK